MSKREKVVRAWANVNERGTVQSVSMVRRWAAYIAHIRGTDIVRVEIRVVPKARKKARKS
jgi:hypothetical protein